VMENEEITELDPEFIQKSRPNYGSTYSAIPWLWSAPSNFPNHDTTMVANLMQSDPIIRKFFEDIRLSTFRECQSKLLNAMFHCLKLLAQAQTKQASQLSVSTTSMIGEHRGELFMIPAYFATATRYAEHIPLDDYRSYRILRYFEEHLDDIKIFACAGQGGTLIWAVSYLYACCVTEEFENSTYISLWDTPFWQQLSSGLDPSTKTSVDMVLKDFERFEHDFQTSVSADAAVLVKEMAIFMHNEGTRQTQHQAALDAYSAAQLPVQAQGPLLQRPGDF
jgi:hypothetical protein